MGAVAAVLERISRPNLNSLTDEELVTLAQKGQTEAFSELVKRHQSQVYNLAYRFARDSVQAEDFAQEAFVKGFRLLKGFRGDCRFSTWMYRVTSSVCLTELKRRTKRAEVPIEDWQGGSAEDEGAENNDLAEIVRRCVAMLPDKYATIVTMYYLEQLPYEEIAAAMKIPVGTLKTWMFRARKELKVIVEKELGDEARAAIG